MLTVVFSTRNRSDLVVDVLDAYCNLQAPRRGWKLLVVDNGSSDLTSQVLERYASRLPLQRIASPVAGKNRALNAALPYAEGDLIVFTDDDAIPAFDWLVRLRKAADAHPEATIFGGTVLPLWPGHRPKWLDERVLNFGTLFAQVSRPSGECTHRSIYGPNMAVRRAVFEAGVRFNETIGPDESAPNYAMGSETELNRRLAAAGHRSWFVEHAVVHHIIRREQLSEEWILARMYRNGLGAPRCDPPACMAGRLLLRGLPIGLVGRAFLYKLLGQVAAHLLPHSPLRIGWMARASWFDGVMSALRKAGVQPARAMTAPLGTPPALANRKLRGRREGVRM